MTIFRLKDIMNPAYRRKIGIDEKMYDMIIKIYYLFLSLFIILPLTLLVGFFTGNLNTSMLYMQLFIFIIGLISVLCFFKLFLKYKIAPFPNLMLPYLLYIKLRSPWGVRLYFFIYSFVVVVLLYFLIKTIRILFL